MNCVGCIILIFPEPLRILFNFIEYLGKGTYGTVFKIQDLKDKTYYALKLCLKKEGEVYDDLYSEIKALRSCSHENIIRYHDCFKSETYVAIKMELANCDLNYLIKNETLDKDQMFEYTKQICEGLAYLHKKNIIHRDLKPGNILWNENKKELKITDLGESKTKKSGSATEISITQRVRGTPNYLPPEQLKEVDSENNIQVNHATDIWSLGIILHMLYTKMHPANNGRQSITDNVAIGNLMIDVKKGSVAFEIIEG